MSGIGPLVEPAWLAQRLEADDVVVLDCTFDLRDKDAGQCAYHAGHVPSARYVDLERDLSAPRSPDGVGGRHPLPEVASLNALFRRLGISSETLVVSYDAGAGVFASRAWWTLRYLGHQLAAVLDGGYAAWRAAGLATATGGEPSASDPGSFIAAPRPGWVASAQETARAEVLLDSREPIRYRGEHEPIDPVAGRIPGARNRFFGDNLDHMGRFRSPAELRAAFTRVGADRGQDCVVYCGSGVSACHNLLAIAVAGLEMPRLYVGSWSDWCSDPSRPVERGTN